MGIDFEKAKQISDKVIKTIIKDNSTEETRQKILVKLSLAQALKQYPKLEEQRITDSLIKLRYSDFPSRPTIKNWITDYYQNLGVGTHGIMERGNFLFHSENCKKLTSSDRQKLALIFKSLSENMPLVIDTERQEIIFPEISSMEQTSQRSNFSHPSAPPEAGHLLSEREGGSSEVRFFSGQMMQPMPPMTGISNHESRIMNHDGQSSGSSHPSAPPEAGYLSPERGGGGSNVDNLSFTSAQKMPAEKNNQEEKSTLRIYPVGYRKTSGGGSPRIDDVKSAGNIVDLKNTNN